MKTARFSVQAGLTLILLATIPVASVYSFAQNNNSVPTKKELKVLLKTAKEPPEHRRIAAYYRQEAARLRAEAKEHSELAAFYAENKSFAAMEAKYGKAFGTGESHCKTFADLAEKQAKEADALAALHDDVAKAAEQKQ